MIATETIEKTHTTSKSFEIHLKNWNDEVPIFDLEEYTTEISEVALIDEEILVVHATDRDIGDEVR